MKGWLCGDARRQNGGKTDHSELPLSGRAGFEALPAAAEANVEGAITCDRDAAKACAGACFAAGWGRGKCRGRRQFWRLEGWLLVPESACDAGVDRKRFVVHGREMCCRQGCVDERYAEARSFAAQRSRWVFVKIEGRPPSTSRGHDLPAGPLSLGVYSLLSPLLSHRRPLFPSEIIFSLHCATWLPVVRFSLPPLCHCAAYPLGRARDASQELHVHEPPGAPSVNSP